MQTKVVELDLNDVLPNRFQPRIKFSEESIQALSESIKEHGVIQPIVVRTIGDKYEIIAGERRYKASILAGKQTIPALITDLNEKDSAEVAIIENVQRKDLTPIEEAISYKKILDMGYLTQETLALKLGKTQSTIANKLRLLNLDDDVQEALLNEKISERHARSLLKLDTHEKQKKLLERIINERLTVRKTDEEIDKMMNNNDNIEMFNFGVPTEPIQETKNEETLEMFNPNVESLNIPAEPVLENSIPELEPNMEPKPTTSFFNPMPEVINSTVPPVSLDMFKEVEDTEEPKFTLPPQVTNEEVNPMENIDNMTDIFVEKPLAPMDSLLKSDSSVETNIPAEPVVSVEEEEEESNEDILVPGKFFNLMQEEPVEEKEEPTLNNEFNFNFDMSGFNNVENTNTLPPMDNISKETNTEVETNENPVNESFFNFDTFFNNELKQNKEANVQVTEEPLMEISGVEESVTEPELTEIPVIPTLEELPVNNFEVEPTDMFKEESQENLEIPTFEPVENVEVAIPELQTEEAVVAPEEENATNIKNAIDLVREFSENLSKLGYIVDLDEFDFENMYQVIFKINK